MGRPGGTGRELHGIRPDLSVARYRFAQSPRGPSQLQLWDVKTIGAYESYATNYHVPPADHEHGVCRLITGVPRSNVIANGMGHRRELQVRSSSRGSLRHFRQYSD